MVHIKCNKPTKNSNSPCIRTLIELAARLPQVWSPTMPKSEEEEDSERPKWPERRRGRSVSVSMN